MQWFAYNGDADGICSMVQWALAKGIAGNRITGVKRDIELLKQIDAKKGDSIIAMDISLARNHVEAAKLNSIGVEISWFDHHLPGEPIDGIVTNVDTSSNVCTAVIVQKYLRIESDWAQVALHGDGLGQFAKNGDLAELGELLNYNGYGADLTDLHFHPDELLLSCIEAKTPQKFIVSDAFKILKDGFEKDILHTLNHPSKNNLTILPDEPWARRVVGVLAHRLIKANGSPKVIALTKGVSFQISIRANDGVGEFCQNYGGGGRATAGGIDLFPKNQIKALMNAVNARWND